MSLRYLMANLPTETDSLMSLMSFSFSLSMIPQRLKDARARLDDDETNYTSMWGELKEEMSRVKKQRI